MTTKNGSPPDATPKSEGGDEREETKYSYPVLKLHQNGHDIYLTTIPIDDLFPFCFVERFHENPEVGYQRKFDSRRADEIAEYLNTAGESIPSSIVLSAQEVAELSYSSKTKQLSYQRVAEAFAVLDGQHRLWGYQKCRTRHRVPVAIYAGLDQQTEARLFLDINNKHKGVPKAHLLNVKSVAGTETETEAALRRLFTQLGRDENSPLRGHLIPGETSPSKLSRTAFDSAIGRALRNDSMRKLPSDKQYELLLNYLRAVHQELDEKDQIVKRNYFGAIFDLFDEVLRKAKAEQNSVKLTALRSIVRAFASIAESDFTGAAKRQRLVAAMRASLHRDTNIDDDDV
jgi:DNA sulfur modification protein DndB